MDIENVPSVKVCNESQFKCPEKSLGIVRNINVSIKWSILH